LGDHLPLLRARYPEFAAQILSPFHDVLLASRAVCGGDMESFLIMLAVALRTVEHEDFRRLRATQVENGGGIGIIGVGTNGRSVAESTGMPRESVRRKVELLIAHGFLMRKHRSLYCTPAAYRAFKPVREALLRMVARHHRIVETLLKEEG
jgi:Holliday junction resolvasome RuvABC ATP-dependent DNA helicase subunit